MPAFTFEFKGEERRCLNRLSSIFNGEAEARSSNAPVGRLSCSRLSRLPKLGGAERRRRCLNAWGGNADSSNSAGSSTGVLVLVGGFRVLLISCAGVDADRRCVGRGVVLGRGVMLLSLVGFRSRLARDSASTMRTWTGYKARGIQYRTQSCSGTFQNLFRQFAPRLLLGARHCQLGFVKQTNELILRPDKPHSANISRGPLFGFAWVLP